MTLPMSYAELASIRAVAASWLNQTCTIVGIADTETDDGWAVGSNVIAAAVPCRAEPASSRGGQEHQAGAGVMSASEWTIHLPHDVPVVNPSYTITVDGVGVFEVVSANSGRGVNTDVAVSCVRRDAA